MANNLLFSQEVTGQDSRLLTAFSRIWSVVGCNDRSSREKEKNPLRLGYIKRLLYKAFSKLSGPTISTKLLKFLIWAMTGSRWQRSLFFLKMLCTSDSKVRPSSSIQCWLYYEAPWQKERLSQPSFCRAPPHPCKHPLRLLKFSNKFCNISQLPYAEELDESFLRVIHLIKGPTSAPKKPLKRGSWQGEHAAAPPGCRGSEAHKYHKGSQTEHLALPSKWVNLMVMISYCICTAKDRYEKHTLPSHTYTDNVACQSIQFRGLNVTAI